MKNYIAACVLGLLSLGGSAIFAADGSTGDIEKAIAALEMKWAEGEKTNNTDLIAPLLADKFFNTDSEGTVTNRAKTLEEERASKYSNSEIDDLKISVYGSTAIANYVLHANFLYKGEAFDKKTRYTDTWVKMPNGTWQCVAAHGSRIKS